MLKVLKDGYSPDMECSECRTRWYVGNMTNGEWNYYPNFGAHAQEPAAEGDR